MPVYEEVGSVTQLLKELQSAGIFEFNNLHEITLFLKNYDLNKRNVITETKDSLTNNLNLKKVKFEELRNSYQSLLSKKIEELNQEKKTIFNFLKDYSNLSIFLKIFLAPKRLIYTYRFYVLNNKLNDEAEKQFSELLNQVTSSEKEIKFIETKFNELLQKNVDIEIKQLKNTFDTLQGLFTLYIGALGEKKAEETLKELPNRFHIINDLNLIFNQPIYYKFDSTYIKSIQIDHLVIGPTGIFLIETKSWNKNSLSNIDLRSPIEQIKRANYALFITLNKAVQTGQLNSFQSNWGDRKISIRNILLMTNAVSREEFQFVKITTPQSNNQYILNQAENLNEIEIKELLSLFI